LSFNSEENLVLHKKGNCYETVSKLPDTDKNWIAFNDYSKCQKHPFVIYADTECILEPISTCFPNNESNSSTTKTHLHTPSAIGYKIFYEPDQPDW